MLVPNTPLAKHSGVAGRTRGPSIPPPPAVCGGAFAGTAGSLPDVSGHRAATDCFCLPRDAAPESGGSERVHIAAAVKLRFTAHERRVLLPLALTGFFETYDVALLTLGAPALAHGLGLGIGTFVFGVALIRLATLASIPVLRLADRWGRRTLLFVSLGIFSIATGMTALAMSFVAFVALQMWWRACSWRRSRLSPALSSPRSSVLTGAVPGSRSWASCPARALARSVVCCSWCP